MKLTFMKMILIIILLFHVSFDPKWIKGTGWSDSTDINAYFRGKAVVPQETLATEVHTKQLIYLTLKQVVAAWKRETGWDFTHLPTRVYITPVDADDSKKENSTDWKRQQPRTSTTVVLDGVMVILLPLDPMVVGSKPGRRRWFLRAINPQHDFLRRGSKAVGPMS
jgi:hypothetical protein